MGDADVVNITAIEALEGKEIVKKTISRSPIDEPSQSHVQIDVLEASVKEKVQKQNPKKDNEPIAFRICPRGPFREHYSPNKFLH